MRAWVVQFPGKIRYVTLEWPQLGGEVVSWLCMWFVLIVAGVFHS